MGKTIGIDLGTTNSVISIIENGTPKILTNAEGSYTTPSIVAFREKGEILVGQIAKRQAINNPKNTVFSSKRFIGKEFSEVKNNCENYSFQTVQKKQGKSCAFMIQGKETSPEQVASLILSKLKKDAEAYLGQEVTDVVITVPAYFNDSQRQATKQACEVANLKVKRIINEPTAAALAYGIDQKQDKIIAVYDFGGGTFDVSILEINNNLIEVKSTNGDTNLGGDDFDEAILNWIINEFKKQEGIDLKKDKSALQRIREESEKAKIELSSALETSIKIPFITGGPAGAKNIDMSLTRSKFEQLTNHLIQKTLNPCEIALKDAKINKSDVNEILMVGGSTRIQAVQESVKKFFGKDLNQSVNPDQIVAMGAAVQAGVLSNDIKDILLLDVTSLSLGIETIGGVMTALISKNTTIPTKKIQTFSTAEDNQNTVSIHVLQGERGMAKDNQTLGSFDLNDIPSAPRGTPKIEVSFDIDSNGIINVSAKNEATGKSQKICIDKPNLSKEEVEEMLKCAKVYKDQDQKAKDIVELKNKIDQLIYQTEKMFKDNKDKLDPKLKPEVQIEEWKKDLKTEEIYTDLKKLQELHDKIQAYVRDLSEKIYKNIKTDGAKQTTKDSSTKKSDKQTIDVDFDKK